MGTPHDEFQSFALIFRNKNIFLKADDYYWTNYNNSLSLLPLPFSNLNDLVLELIKKVTNSIEVHLLSYIHLLTELNRLTETVAQILFDAIAVSPNYRVGI